MSRRFELISHIPKSKIWTLFWKYFDFLRSWNILTLIFKHCDFMLKILRLFSWKYHLFSQKVNNFLKELQLYSRYLKTFFSIYLDFIVETCCCPTVALITLWHCLTLTLLFSSLHLRSHKQKKKKSEGNTCRTAAILTDWSHYWCRPAGEFSFNASLT